MKVFLSVFKHEKCASCNRAFQITWKRRLCKQCQKLFCTECSVKLKAPGFFKRNRFCLQCHAIIEKKSRGTTIVIEKSESDYKNPRQQSENFTTDFTPLDCGSPLKPEENKSEPVRVLARNLRKRVSSLVSKPVMSSQFTILKQNPFLSYSIIEEKYSVGSVTVYIVNSLSDSNFYSMKKLSPQDSEEKSLIIEEALLHLTSLHRNILKYHSVYDYQNFLYIIVEKHDGILYDLVRAQAGFISEKYMSYVCKEILNGLLYLHSNNRIHRDIKSKNVTLLRTGEIKLGDFGYTGQVLEEQLREIHNPSWMAPELVTGADYNESVDLWALGILLFEMAEGVPPYDGETNEVIMHNIVHNPAPRLKNKLKWSKDLTNFLSLCLRKESIERPSAESLLKHPFIEDHDEETAQEQFSEYYCGVSN